MLVSVLVLTAAAIAALFLTLTRPSPLESKTERHEAARALALAVGAQSVHFAEEAATGFHERFPALFGLPEMPLSYFIIFNLTWLAIWTASVPGLGAGRRPAFFAAWFLAIAGILNGVVHPLFAVAARSYFPGLVSSPLIGVAGAVVWIRLRSATGGGMGR